MVIKHEHKNKYKLPTIIFYIQGIKSDVSSIVSSIINGSNISNISNISNKNLTRVQF